MDQFYSFNTIRKTTIQFLDIFNNIQIAKYNKNKEIVNYVRVPIKYGPKQKFYYWIYQRSHEKIFPIIGVHLSSVEPSFNEYGVNKNIKLLTENNSYYINNLIPCRFTYELSIAALYNTEIDQILEQIIPFFTPYISTRVNIPELDIYFDCKNILTSVSPEVDTDISEDNYRIINWNLSFDVKSYVLKPIYDTKIINEIYLKIKDINNLGPYETLSLSGDNYEYNIDKGDI